MKLKEFVDSLMSSKRWTCKECAAFLNISVSQMYMICRDDHNISIVTARKIQKITANKVKLADLVPDNWDQ